MTKKELIDALSVVPDDANLPVVFTTDWGGTYTGNVVGVTIKIKAKVYEAVIEADEPEEQKEENAA